MCYSTALLAEHRDWKSRINASCWEDIRPAELAGTFGGNPGLWGTALALAVFSTAIPYLLYTWGLARTEPGKASILASLEPVAATLTGVLAFGETLGPLTALGILCVLAGVIILR